MHEITHDHLNDIATRLEESFRREVDTLRADIAKDMRATHHRIDELKAQVAQQNSRIGKSEDRIGDLKSALATLRSAPVLPANVKEEDAAANDPPYITRRDLKVACFVIVSLGGLIQFLVMSWPVLTRGLTP